MLFVEHLKYSLTGAMPFCFMSCFQNFPVIFDDIFDVEQLRGSKQKFHELICFFLVVSLHMKVKSNYIIFQKLSRNPLCNIKFYIPLMCTWLKCCLDAFNFKTI